MWGRPPSAAHSSAVLSSIGCSSPSAMMEPFADYGVSMAFPIKICSICSEEFELKPDKPGFANQCPECSAREPVDRGKKRTADATQRKTEREANEARRQAMRDLLYRKDS